MDRRSNRKKKNNQGHKKSHRGKDVNHSNAKQGTPFHSRTMASSMDANQTGELKRMNDEKNSILEVYFKDLTDQEIDEKLEYVVDKLDMIEYNKDTSKNKEFMEIIMGEEFENELENWSYLEYYLKQKHAIEKPALTDESSDRNKFKNPFKFDAFESINRIATILNYDVLSVVEYERKNPFQMMNKNISEEIRQYTKQLEKLAKQNRDSLKQLNIKASKEIEKEKKKNLATEQLATKELEYLKHTVINLELKQLAESWVRVYSKRKDKTHKSKGGKHKYEYRMIFDESVRIPPLWLTEDQYNLLNQNREEFKSEDHKAEASNSLFKIYSNEETNYGFCHQWKQRKANVILAKWHYKFEGWLNPKESPFFNNTETGGNSDPSVVSVRGVKAYNVESYNTQAINYLVKTQINKIKKKKDDESTTEYFDYNECNRQYCSFWLKFHYDLSLSDCQKKDWLCPFCQGICHWTRCSRQEQLVKMKALLFAEGGNLDHLFETDSIIYRIIAENWIRSEKLMIRTDRTPIPPSPLKVYK